jgi:HSP20 family molecular chaperone IbpA
MSLFVPQIQGFAPLFRLADEIERASRGGSCPARRSPAAPSFLPRFDVKETKDAYELTGELPGIEQADVNIEWTDEHTLSISGHSESRSTRTNAPEPAAAPAEPEKAESETSSAYQKPSVEDDGQDFVDVEKPTTEDQSTSEEKVEEPVAAKQATTQRTRYLITERSSGTFRRVFKFPGHVDHDNVKASLKNGVLSISAPKALPKEPRRIVIN